MARDAARTLPKAVPGLRDEANEAGGFAWVGLVEPTAEEFEAVTREFGLHELAVEDAVSAHQRPKLEIYDEALFLVLKTVRYLETEERVEIGEVMLFVGPDFLITVRHGEAGGLGNVREQLEQQPELLAFGPGAATVRNRRSHRRRVRPGGRSTARGHRRDRGGGLLTAGAEPGRADLPASPRGTRVRPSHEPAASDACGS